MKRIKLTVAYDGTNYHGWQIQPNAVTVEGELNKAISELTGEHIEVIGASRTDAGVHALGNVAVFDTESRIPGEKFSYALNQRLPEDIIIQSSEEVALDFHPRYQECRKTYEYTILNRKFPLPEYRNTAHFDYGNLDVKAMQDACKAFIGEHDFAGFCSAGAQVKTTIRTIYSLEVECIELGKAKPDGCLLYTSGNDEFVSVIVNKKAARRNIANIFEEITIDSLPDSDEIKVIHVKTEDKYYRAVMKLIVSDSPDDDEMVKTDINQLMDNSRLISVFLYDETDMMELEQKREAENLVVGLLYIDNYDELIDSIDEIRQSLIMALIDRKINKYMQGIDCLLYTSRCV